MCRTTTYCGVNRELAFLELLKSKCALTLLYGLDAMYFDVKIRKVIRKAWNRAIRAVFSIKSRENTRHLLYFCNLWSTSLRIGLCYLKVNLLYSLKTYFYSNAIESLFFCF